LALVKNDQSLEALPIFKYLATKEDDIEFTQESLISLQAITAMIKALHAPNTDLRIEMKINDNDFQADYDETIKRTKILMAVDLRNDNKKDTLPAATRQIQFDAQGTGVALVDMTYQYDLDVGKPEKAFEITIEASGKREFTICAQSISGNVESSIMTISLADDNGDKNYQELPENFMVSFISIVAESFSLLFNLF